MDLAGPFPGKSIFGATEGGPLAPVALGERIAIIDVLRGVAILGIFLVNMPLYVAPSAAFFHWDERLLWTDRTDRLALLFLHIFAQGKFYTVFSLLFGVGFGMQMMRAEERGSSSFDVFYRRRLLVLLIIGLVHLTMIWWGDVLHIYAVLGFVLLHFRYSAGKTLLVWAACLSLLPFVAITSSLAHTAGVNPSAEVEPAHKRIDGKKQRQAEVAEDLRIHSSASVGQIMKLRWKRVAGRAGSEVGWAVELFAAFLVGLWAARRQILQQPHRHRSLLTRLAFIALPLGLAVSAADLIYIYLHPVQPWTLAHSVLSLFREFIARPAMGLGYAALVIVARGASWLRPLAAVGRMALTNYLLQSVVFTTVANAYGLGLYGKISPAAGLALCAAFFALQVALSVWWLRHHAQGPVENLWRRLSYRAG